MMVPAAEFSFTDLFESEMSVGRGKSLAPRAEHGCPHWSGRLKNYLNTSERPVMPVLRMTMSAKVLPTVFEQAVSIPR